MTETQYSTLLAAGGHWSLRVRRGTFMRITDVQGGANLGMLMYNPENLLERYNAPDTLKCQHTFKLTQGHCLYSDMGRIFASVVEDTHGWHETMTGNCTAKQVQDRWGARNYQEHKNAWQQNGHDAFLVELAKYGLSRRDLAANINWFSKVVADELGNIKLDPQHSFASASVSLRFEMDTLVVMHACAHPMNLAKEYPAKPVKIALGKALPIADDDLCKNFCAENQRGFENNFLYNFMER
jgi:urea carboxylase-associated protein 2